MNCPASLSFVKKPLETSAWVADDVREYTSNDTLKSRNESRISAWYLSTTCCGVTPSFWARMVMGTPCSSEPQINFTSRPAARK